MEPWLYSYYLSSDRLSNRFGEKPNKPNSTFWERKKMLEDPHKGIKMLSKRKITIIVFSDVIFKDNSRPFVFAPS